jgi:hypothetical protein
MGFLFAAAPPAPVLAITPIKKNAYSAHHWCLLARAPGSSLVGGP